MILFTLPDTPPGSLAGITHLIIVGVLLVVSILCIALLAILHDEIPPVLDATTTLGIGYLVGVNVVKGNGQ